MKNLVSISAVSNREQLREIAKIVTEENFQTPLAIGYQVSNKSINHGTQGLRQPRFTELGEIDKETRDLGLITSIHYYTKDNSTIIPDLERIAQIGINSTSTLLQFNTLPPSEEILRQVKNMGYEILFKVAVSDKQNSKGGYAVWTGDDVVDIEGGDLDPLISQVYERKNVIDYIMFDPSHGTNLELNLDEESLAMRFGKAIVTEKSLDHLGLMYAGGINPGNVKDLTKTLTSSFPKRISIDIESGVRTKDDKLDMGLVRSYLVNCKNMI